MVDGFWVQSMEQKTAGERKLFSAIVDLQDEESSMCSTKPMDEEQQQERRIRDLSKAKDLEAIVREALKFAWICEAFLEAGLPGRTYDMYVRVCWDGIKSGMVPRQ